MLFLLRQERKDLPIARNNARKYEAQPTIIVAASWQAAIINYYKRIDNILLYNVQNAPESAFIFCRRLPKAGYNSKYLVFDSINQIYFIIDKVYEKTYL